jgi:hypothetical protein
MTDNEQGSLILAALNQEFHDALNKLTPAETQRRRENATKIQTQRLSVSAGKMIYGR